MSADFEWQGESEAASPLVTQLISIAFHPIGVLRRRWGWMLSALLVGWLAAAAMPFLIQPQYESRATVLISSQQIPEEFVRSTVSGLDSLANVNSLMGEVLSQRKLAALIEKHDLYGQSRFSAPLDAVIAGMRESIAITKQRNIEGGSSSGRGETSSIFAITFVYADPTASAAVTNDLANIFVNESIEKRSEQAHTTTEFLRRQLNRAELDLQEVNHQITEFRHAHRGEMPNELDGILAKLERLQGERQAVARQIGDAEHRLSLLESKELEKSSPEARLLELRLQLASEVAINTEEHPNVIALKRRIERMENEVRATSTRDETILNQHRDRLVASKRELEGLRERLREIDESVRELDQRAGRVPKNDEDLKALDQRGMVLRENYVEFLRKVQDAELAETLESAQQGPRVTVLDPASVPTAPVHSAQLFLAAGVAASVALALALGVALELIDPVVLSAEHLEATGAIPLLGAVREIA